jgi:eukaryotic-like serine/threonine-protein kinase
VIATSGGEAQLLLGNQGADMSTLDRTITPTSWSRDGKYLLFNGASDSKTGLDLWVYPMDGKSKPFPFLETEFRESDGQFSPDGRFVAYVSTESGREEVYVRSFSPDGDRPATTARGRWMVSAHGGVNPRWSADGKELTFLSRTPNVVGIAVAVSADTGFQIGSPRELPRLPTNTVFVDASADGTRLLVGLETAQTASGPMPINLILHWANGLKP